MKHFPKLICGFLVLCTISVHAQKENVVFPYSHNSLVELIKDTSWIKASAEKYMQYVNNGSIGPYIVYEISACAILNENEEGLKLISKELLPIEKSVMSYPRQKSLYSIWYGYFYYALHPEKNSYYNAVQQTFAKCDLLPEDRKYMYGQQLWPDTSEKAFGSIINASRDTDDSIASRLSRFLPTLHNLNRPEKNLKIQEMAEILIDVSSRKIALAIKDEQIRFANDQLPIITKEEHIPVDVIKITDKAMRETYPPDEPGAAIVIMLGDKILLNKGYGLSDINTKEKITPNTNFNIASISKMFTATAILLLVKQGKLQLQDPVIKYLTDVNPNIGKKITIYQLLTHSSGLPRYIPTKDSLQGLMATDKDAYKWEKDIDSLDFVPGTKFGYSNIGYRWLSLIIEKITGTNFQDFMRDSVFLRAGMKNSFELNKDAPIPNFAHAYKKAGNKFIEDDYGEEPLFSTIGDGGVVTSTDDLIAWEKAMRNYKVLPKELFEETIKPQVNSGEEIPNSFYGFGWFIQNTPGSPTVYSHTGLNAGFVSYFFRIPEKKIMMALLCNRNYKNSEVGYFVKELMKQAGWY